jgi:membrane-associated protein
LPARPAAVTLRAAGPRRRNEKPPMDLLRKLADFILHIDKHLVDLAGDLGPWMYALVFAIVFCETGLVVLPFLPGDSLLFATGALIARPDSPMDLLPTAVLLIVAAVVGDAVNYSIGARLGPAVFTQRRRFLNPKYIERTQAFYEKHGKKTIFLARFVPIVRTFAPFLAGIGRMQYRTFALYNVTGGVTWVLLFLLAGWQFGQLPIVQERFQLVIFGIIFLSILPILWELARAKLAARRAAG